MLLSTRKQWLLTLISLLAIAVNGCDRTSPREVVVYVSVDRIYAEPILEKFSQATGIKVLPVYDVEATKTTGLANRLLLEKNRPQADVFWSGEFVQTLMLKQQNVLVPYTSASGEQLPAQYRDPQGYWYGVGGRARILLANTEKLAENQYPQSLTDLVSLAAGGQPVGIAYPIFGTSATHAAALYAHWGNAQAEQFYRSLQEKGVRVVDGNSVVRDLVVNGQLAIGLTDTDDACSAVAKGEPVEIIFPDQGPGQMGAFVLTGSVALIANAPHPEAGQALVDFLIAPSTEAELIQLGGSQLPLHSSSPVSTCLENFVVKPMAVNPTQVFEQLETSKRDLQTIFVR
ncbi:extracellular solute-binding protein [Synechocystis sp. CACIAM 05]|uniref:extracellular solute-binding protein n=1 Tax=Synechocystis sp. CACIAM 05 TaxID=1933929 RepID=UPI00138E616F|nr:extracellular solute-binding protein [Synechocystis sp. CACIAM 05]QHV00081.1 ABC transporter substrate-binding protein [Synechocystis sp. CACIAM 05]